MNDNQIRDILNEVHAGYLMDDDDDFSHSKAMRYLVKQAQNDLLTALERLTHPMADDDDLQFALETIAKAKGQA